LILQYEDEIRRAQLMQVEEEKLLELRQRLYGELELLRGERTTLETRISEELKILRVEPMEAGEQAGWVR